MGGGGGGGGDNCLYIRPVYKGGVLLLRNIRDAWPVQARSQWGFEGFSRTPNFCRKILRARGLLVLVFV